ncbi:MAG TPA: cation-transporting P-type ATPase [Chloroflexota bacterium]|nr:cation-transporting P-type ATPase [Chloroflexota bacterium]
MSQNAGAASDAGLSSAEAKARLASHGPNDIAQVRRITALTEVGSFLLNPLVVILLAASAISLVLGYVTDAGIIVLIVLLSVVLTSFRHDADSGFAVATARLIYRVMASGPRSRRWLLAPW